MEPWIHEKHDVEFGQHIAHVKEMFFNSISKSYLDMGYVLQGNFNATSRLFSAGNHQTLGLLNSIGHLVHYNFEYLLNNLDEPISLPASDHHDQNTIAIKTY